MRVKGKNLATIATEQNPGNTNGPVLVEKLGRNQESAAGGTAATAA